MRSNQILSIIPARGGSKGIPKKNIKLLRSRPLLAYTADASLNSQYITRHILSTDNEQIAQTGRDYGLEVPFMRPSYLATDDSPSIDCFQYTLRQLMLQEDYEPDLLVILQPTSPLRTATHVDEAIRLFLKTDCDSLVSIVEVPHNTSPLSAMKRDSEGYVTSLVDPSQARYQRQMKPRFFARNGAAIYITTPQLVCSEGSLYGKRIFGYEMTKLDSIDIDDELDWTMAEALLAWRYK